VAINPVASELGKYRVNFTDFAAESEGATGVEGVRVAGVVGVVGVGVAASGALVVGSVGDLTVVVLAEAHPVRNIPTRNIVTILKKRVLSVCLDIIYPPSS